MHTAVRVSDSAPLASLLPSWELALQAAGKSPKTITSYLGSVKSLAAYLAANDMTDDTERTGPAEIRGFLLAEIGRTSATSAAVHYRNLRVYFGWLVREDERQAGNPMLTVDKPNAPEKVKPFLTEQDQAALLRACSGQDFEARRDTALLRIFIDTGVRVSGLAGLRYHPTELELTDVFLAQKRLRVRLKGGRETWVPIGAKSAAAIDKYLRARVKHPHADSSWLWLGTRGTGVQHMTDSGIRAMLKRRGQQAGVQGVHPHRFRHTFADQWLANGGNVDDLMHIAGWQTYDMPLRYAKGRGLDRAHAAHARLSPGDRL
jgi:site-specific recombinase XerD